VPSRVPPIATKLAGCGSWPTCRGQNEVSSLPPCERTVKLKVNGEDRVATYAAVGKLPKIVEAFEKAKKASSKAEIMKLTSF